MLLLSLPCAAPAKDPGWQPKKTWVFVVGVLSWKHSDMFGSFPVKNRRDNTLVTFFKQNGVPESQVVYLQDKQATQQRIDSAFTEQLKKLNADDLLIVYYAGHGSKSDNGNDVYLRLGLARPRLARSHPGAGPGRVPGERGGQARGPPRRTARA